MSAAVPAAENSPDSGLADLTNLDLLRLRAGRRRTQTPRARSNVGQVAESLALAFYNETPGRPKTDGKIEAPMLPKRLGSACG